MTLFSDVAKLNEPLSRFSTLGIGGPAQYLLEVRDIDEMNRTIRICVEKKIAYIIIGKGSNCLFDDLGFKGAVILNKIEGMAQPAPGRFVVGAGYSFSLLGTQTARQGWAGLEFACGIPGTVGGAVFMNAGANGFDTSQNLIQVDFLHESGELVTYEKKDLEFSYRYSIFQKMRGAIVGAVFQLSPSEEAREKQIQIINTRKKTQPLTEKSAGCIFRNPSGDFAGRLIETCGLKGAMIGGAQVSEIHANFLINAQGATCSDLQTLVKTIQQTVKEKTGHHLEMEVRYIPYE